MERNAFKIIANTLAMVVILGFISVAANSLRISLQTSGVFGPTVLATDAAGNVYINLASTLYVLDESGRLENRIPVSELGLQGATLTDLLALPDGRLLIGSGNSRPKIRSCDLVKRLCAPFIRSGNEPVSAFKMAWDAEHQRLLVVDGKPHRILVYDRGGKLTLESKGGKRGLLLPNTMLLAGDSSAIIADTNHHRLVALDAQTLSRELWELPVRNDLGNFRRDWPTDVAAVGEGYWVILDDDLLENGDVVLFAAGGEAMRRLSLPDDWDPIKLHARGHDVLLAGCGSVDLVSVPLDGKSVMPFGDAAFRNRLAEVRNLRRIADDWWGSWIWLAIVPLLALGAIAAWLDWKRRQGVSGPVPTAVKPETLPESADGIYWLQPDPKVAGMWRLSRWLLYLLVALLLAPAIYIATWAGLEKSLGIIVPLIGGSAVMMVMLVTGLNTVNSGRLGVTREQVVLSTDSKAPRHFHPRQLVYSNSFVSSGDITVYLRTGKSAIYKPGEISGYLEPRLASARKLKPLQSYIYLLQQGDRLTWVSILGIAVLIGLSLYSKLNTS